MLVDARVLIPRPETEILVEEAIKFLRTRPGGRILDVGTGSGAIPLAIKDQVSASEVVATDIASGALQVARLNALRLNLDVSFIQTNLIDGICGKFDVLTANLPYIPTSAISKLDRNVRLFEPLQALDGGHDGIQLIRQLLSTVSDALAPHAQILLEFQHDQAERISTLVSQQFVNSSICILRDLGGHTRAIRIEMAKQ